MKKVTGRYQTKAIKKTMQILTDNWNDLQTLAEGSHICYRGVSKEDVLIDAFERVSRDKTLLKADEAEILEAFKKEFKQLHFRAVKNCKAERRKYGLDL